MFLRYSFDSSPNKRLSWCLLKYCRCDFYRYERNKHIFPASRWETYDPNVKRESYTIHGGEVDHEKWWPNANRISGIIAAELFWLGTRLFKPQPAIAQQEAIIPGSEFHLVGCEFDARKFRGAINFRAQKQGRFHIELSYSNAMCISHSLLSTSIHSTQPRYHQDTADAGSPAGLNLTLYLTLKLTPI